MNDLRSALKEKAFLVLRQELTPLLGTHHPIAPPTFADARERYQIDWLIGEGLRGQADVARAQAEGGKDRDPVMALGVPQERRATPWGPGAPHQGGQLEPGLIEEDEVGAQPPGVFFTRGHVSLFHRSILVSSRSRARRFWLLGAPPHLVQEPAHMIGMVGYAKALTNDFGHTRRGPQVRVVARRHRSGQEHVGQGTPLLLGELGRSPVGILIAETYDRFNLSQLTARQQQEMLGPFFFAQSIDPVHQNAIAQAIRAPTVLVAEMDGEIVGVLRGGRLDGLGRTVLQSLFVSGRPSPPGHRAETRGEL